MQFAPLWALTTEGSGRGSWCAGLTYSVTKITLGSGVSRRTINTMRSKLKQFQSEGVEPPQRWMDVLLQGKTWDADEADGKFAEQVAKLTKAISKGLGPAKAFKSTSRIDALAAALIDWSGRNAEELALSLVESLGLEERIMEAAAESELVEEWREAKRFQEQRTEF